MRTVRNGPAIGLIAQLVVLAALSSTVGLSVAGWIVGVACGLIMYAALTYGLASEGTEELGPADRVTLTRAILVGGVAALTADSFVRTISVPTLVAITVVALVGDAIDGWVARRTSSASSLGARFDMEVDAFGILVLSVYAARSAGWWVLAIGGARYAFVVAGWLLPWMRAALPPRYWRKVVAAVQGIALAFAATKIASHGWTGVTLAVSLILLAESFGHDIWWQWRRMNQTKPRTVFPAETLLDRAGRHAEIGVRRSG